MTGASTKHSQSIPSTISADRKAMILYTSLMMLTVGVFGWLVTDALVNWNQRRMAASLENRAHDTAITLNVNQLKGIALHRSADLQRAKQQVQDRLEMLKNSDESIVKIALLVRVDTQYYQVLETDKPLTENLGQRYTENSKLINQAHAAGEAMLARPDQIGQGKEVTAYSPVIITDADRQIVMLAMQFNTQQEAVELEKLRFFGLGATALLALFGVGCVWLGKMRDDLKKSISAKRQLEMQTRRLAMVAELAGSPMLITDTHGKIEWVNNAFLKLTQLEKPQVIEHSPGQLLYGPQTDVDTIARIDHALKHRESIKDEILAHRLHADPIWLSIDIRPVEDDDHQLEGHIAVFHDISSRKAHEQELILQAKYDPLTRLPNRAMFLDLLNQRFYLPLQRRGEQYAIMFLDLDGFKAINDNLGHHAGDEVLVQFAERLKSCVRDRDVVARLAGDEFTILLHDIRDHDEAITVALRILELMAHPMQVIGEEVHPTSSIGLAFSHGSYENPDELLADADAAMYEAKNSGKNRYVMRLREYEEEALTDEDETRLIDDETLEASSVVSSLTDTMDTEQADKSDQLPPMPPLSDSDEQAEDHGIQIMPMTDRPNSPIA